MPQTGFARECPQGREGEREYEAIHLDNKTKRPGKEFEGDEGAPPYELPIGLDLVAVTKFVSAEISFYGTAQSVQPN